MARGDVLSVRRRGLYRHVGIDAGDGEVIHYSGEPGKKRKASVQRTAMHAFARGGKVRRRKFRRADPPGVVIERAESRLGEAQYSLTRNNCEHYATWCKTGKKRSAQMRQGVATFASLVLGLLALVGARTVSSKRPGKTRPPETA